MGEYREDDLTTIIGGKRFRLFSLLFYMVGNLEDIIKNQIVTPMINYPTTEPNVRIW